jgi:hypothetical protein
MGAYVSDTENMMLLSRTSNAKLSGQINTVLTNGTATVDGRGLVGFTRATGSSNRLDWVNGVLVDTIALGTNGTALPSIELILGGYNNNGVRAGQRNTVMCVAMVVAPMSAPQQAALYTAVQNMMTARGWAV